MFHKLIISEFNPEFKKGAQALGHFTTKLDKTLADEFHCASQCEFVASGGVCPHKQQKQMQWALEQEQLKQSIQEKENMIA